jgi:hypothetical protein
VRKKKTISFVNPNRHGYFRLDKIPCFLQKYAATVLSTGKYLNVIQQCDKSAQWAALQSLEYLPNSEHYHPIIEKVVVFTSYNAES